MLVRFTSVAEGAGAGVTAVRTVELGSLAPESKLVRNFGVEMDLVVVAAEVATLVLLADLKEANSDDPTLAAVSSGVEAQERRERASALRAVLAAVVGLVIFASVAWELSGSIRYRDGFLCQPMLVFPPAASRFAAHWSSLRKWLFLGRASTERLGTAHHEHIQCKPARRCQY